MIQGRFEAKKHAYRQTQDGVVISFVIHPNDVSPELAAAPLGTILDIVYSEPADNGGESHTSGPSGPVGNTHAGTGEPAAPAKRPWRDRRASERAALLCKDAKFRDWYAFGKDEEIAATMMREMCRVQSRSELDTNEAARFRFESIEYAYKQAMGLETEKRG